MQVWRKIFVAGWRLQRISPRIGARLMLEASKRRGEPELHFVRALARADRVSVDVGANWGMYCGMFQPVSRQVVAFEPNPVRVADLRRAWPGLRVEACALGEQAGTGTLRVPLMASGQPATGFGTLAATGFEREGFTDEIAFIVPIRRLDDVHLGPIGFIKVDVEGSEEAVLAGATRTIERDRPNLMIELNRHPEPTVARLAAHGYSAHFVHEGALRPFAEWSPEIRGWQGDAPNNFLFKAA